MPMTYILLGLAILAVWFPPVRVGGRVLAPWAFAFGAAVAVGLAGGVLSWPAILPLAAMAGLARLESRWCRQGEGFGWRRGIAGTLAGLLALALALHALPGFHNPRLLSAVTLSPGAPPFTQYLNFDKGAAGLFLLLYCPRSARLTEILRWAQVTLAAAGLTTALVVGLALLLGHVGVDPKWPPLGGWLLATNLLFTCAPEEAFFRGLIQAPLAGAFRKVRFGAALAAVLSTVLFVLAHAPTDAVRGLLVALVGLGAASVFALSRRIEPAIFAHFTVNAVHLLLFTYPRLQG
jgi:uncharacterized protein